MPPRYAYWTIIVDNQPTAFRSSSQEELMPTFKRLKAKNDSAVMMWWQHGKLWSSRVEAQEAMIAGREIGRRADERQPAHRSSSGGGTGTGFRNRDSKPSRPSTYAKAPADRQAFKPSGGSRTAWTPRGEPSGPPPARNADEKLDWKPKGEFVPAPKRADRPDWKPKGSFERKPEWKPRSSFDREERPRSFKRPEFKPSGDSARSAKPEWKPKGSFKPSSPSTYAKAPADRQAFKPRSEKPEWKPKGSFEPQPRRPRPTERPDWTPRSGHTSAQPSETKRKWVPKEEYKKSMGIEARRDSKWRPGGEHKDPKQKYKDAKKAKWTKFKQNIRARSGGKGRKPS